MSKDMSIEMSEDMSIEMSEDMSEKDVRRYVTKNVSIERPLLNSRRLGAWRLT